MSKNLMSLTTHRLILRPWRESDFEPFAKMNADPRVREYFPSVLTTAESNAEALIRTKYIQEHGWGFWAVSVPNIAEFIGFIGLRQIGCELPFFPAVEIGWSLAFDYWGKGYATEGAVAAMKYGFDTLKLQKIVSYTAAKNCRSRAVMEKIGLTHAHEKDFDHPKLPEGHPLRRHVLYLKEA